MAGGQGDVEFLFAVALSKELVDDHVGPIFGDVEGAARVGDVGCFEEDFEQQLAVLCVIFGEGGDAVFELCYNLDMIAGEVCGYNTGDDGAPHQTVLLSRQVLQNVTLGLLQDAEQLGAVVVLQRRQVVVQQGQGMADVDQKEVAGGRVVQIVGNGGDEQAQDLQRGQVLAGLAFGQHQVDALRHIPGMSEIVVRVAAMIAFVNGHQEMRKGLFLNREFPKEVKVLKKSGHKGHQVVFWVGPHIEFPRPQLQFFF